MTDLRSRIAVSTSYSKETSRITLTQKNVPAHENSFYIQVVQYSGGLVRISLRIEDGEIIEQLISESDLNTLKENLLATIEVKGMVRILTILGNKIQTVHFENDEIGIGIGKGKYLLEETDKALLKEFCLQSLQ